MALNLPYFDRAVKLVEEDKTPTFTFHLWWQKVVENLESTVTSLQQAIADIIVAQATADTAQATADTAQTTADTATTLANTAQASADAVQAEVDSLADIAATGSADDLIAGNVPLARFNNGTDASVSTFWRGDGTWADPLPAGPIVLPSYSAGALPSPATPSLIWVTNDVNGPIPAYSDGTNWRRVDTSVVVNLNLITNSYFTTDTSGWSLYTGYGPGTFTSVSGVGHLVDTGPAAILAYQAISTVIGETYRFTGDIIAGSGSLWGARKADDPAATVNVEDLARDTTGIGLTDTFVATATTTYIILQCNGGSMDIDNVTVCHV